MPTPFPSRRIAPTSRTGAATAIPSSIRSADWRCTCCDKLLGVCRDGDMHLRFSRGHEYLVGFPVTATCRGCGTLNRASAPAR